MLARPAAIKLIRADSAGGISKDTLARFEREAQATAALSSPHTVQVYDFGITEEGAFYYVMELLTGLDADKLIRRHGPLPPERAVYLLLQVCKSLEEAHAREFVHRDIKQTQGVPVDLSGASLSTERNFLETGRRRRNSAR